MLQRVAVGGEVRASIERQTYRELEVILIDDGSTDDTGTLLDRLAAQDSRVRVIREIATFATSD